MRYRLAVNYSSKLFELPNNFSSAGTRRIVQFSGCVTRLCGDLTNLNGAKVHLNSNCFSAKVTDSREIGIEKIREVCREIHAIVAINRIIPKLNQPIVNVDNGWSIRVTM